MTNQFDKTILITKKKIIYSLIDFFGINFFSANLICKNLGINPSIRVNLLKKIQIQNLLTFIDQYLIVNIELKKKILFFHENLLTLKTYRGLRNLKGLPVRGQRTHTNGKTKRKNKKF